ncbi:hypothetical protein HED60_20125 [Planctomycetales bacterium ZRK34]|nr:hypothetical protein HED60_20125 [Planctomycetales bacterium ZRK34]
MRCFPILTTILVASFFLPVAVADKTRPGTVEQLAARSQQTARQLNDNTLNLSWTTKIHLSQLNLDVWATSHIHQGLIRHTFRANLGGNDAELFDIIIRDGLWYVHEAKQQPAKYRPYEAPLRFPDAYLLIKLAQWSTLPAGVDFEINNMSSTVATIGLGRTQSLDYRQPVRVDRETGIILNGRILGASYEVRNLSAEPAPADTFKTDAVPWADHTADPTDTDNVDNLIMAPWSPMATPANAQQLQVKSMVCLVNISTGQVRRVPFDGWNSLAAGCFNKDHKKVYLCGKVALNQPMAIVEIDLSTGTNRRITTESLGLLTRAALSPDNRTLATAAINPLGQSQVLLVDVITGKTRPLGAPGPFASPLWLPEGTGLLLVHRRMIARDQPPETMLVQMGLEGKLTTLRPGNVPQILPSSGRILFCDSAWKWHTCNLKGTDVKLYPGTILGAAAAAVSPDQRRIVWLQYPPQSMPQLVIQRFGRKDVDSLDLGRGLWGVPAW